MSKLLDPLHRRLLSQIGVRPGMRTLEVGWAQYWRQTITELRPRLEESGHLAGAAIDAFLRQRSDPAWWTQTFAFTVVSGRLSGTDRDR